MRKTIKPYITSEKSKKEQVTDMFNTISDDYDKLNRIITFGVDKKWRKKAIKIATKNNPKIILDVATGTGDLAILAAQKTKDTKIIGIDISEGMLEIGKQKISKTEFGNRIQLLPSDSESLTFDDNYFDAVTVAFGVRNFENLDKGLSEIYRVLKKGGVFVVLETSVPTIPLIKNLYMMHTKKVMPFLGKLFSKDAKAYQYLSNSAQNFPYGKEFNNILIKNGFINVINKPQMFGASTIYVANK